MSTTLNPSCVCDTHHVSPVDQLFQRSTDFLALDPEQQKQVEPTEAYHEWPIYLVDVPEDWEPNSPNALPPSAKRFKNVRIASQVAAILNRDLLDRSETGYVQSWHIRISKGVVSISIPAYLKFKPVNEYVMPPANFTLNESLSTTLTEIALMNLRLVEVDKQRTRRAYIGYSIEHELNREHCIHEQPVKQPVVTIQKQPNQCGAVYLVDVPSNYEPYSWKSLPGSFQRVKDCEVAKVAAIRANQRIISKANGIVQAWYIVAIISGGYGIVQITPTYGWIPADAYDTPVAMVDIQGQEQRKQYIKDLNKVLDKKTYGKSRKRAYAAIPVVRPEELRELRPDEQRPKAEPQKIPAEQKPIPPSPPFPGPEWEKMIPPKNGNSVEITGIQSPQETADDLLKRHGLELHKRNGHSVNRLAK